MIFFWNTVLQLPFLAVLLLAGVFSCQKKKKSDVFFYTDFIISQLFSRI